MAVVAVAMVEAAGAAEYSHRSAEGLSDTLSLPASADGVRTGVESHLVEFHRDGAFSGWLSSSWRVLSYAILHILQSRGGKLCVENGTPVAGSPSPRKEKTVSFVFYLGCDVGPWLPERPSDLLSWGPQIGEYGCFACLPRGPGVWGWL